MFIGINMGIVGSLMGGASILALFASGEVGLWFEPNDITTLYQDVNGTTPVTAPGQTVGLMLDKSQGLVLGSELLANGVVSLLGTATAATYSTTTGVGSVSRVDASNQSYIQWSSLTSTSTYKMRVTCTSGAISVRAGVVSAPVFQTLTAGQTLDVYASPVGGVLTLTHQPAVGTATFTITSFKLLAGNHATQPTAAQRPTYGVIPYGGVRNLANGSGAVGDINYWTSTNTVNGVTATRIATGIDTDGLPYADFTISGTCTATSAIALYANRSNSRFLTPTGTVCTASVIARRISGPAQPFNCGVRAEAYGETSPGNTINEAYNGNLVDSATDTMSTLSPTLVNAATNQMSGQVTFRSELGATVNATYRVKGFQFEKAAARSAFQLNLSKYNVTEAGKASLGVLYPDGIDDWMVTPSINFTGTDKVSTWVAVDKMLNSAQAIVFELSADTNSNNGVFNAQIPLGSGQPLRFVSRGTITSLADMTSSLYAAPSTVVAYGSGDISGDNALLFANNVQVAQSVTDQGTGNYGNYPVYLFRRGAGALFFGSIFSGLIIRGAQSSAAQISNANAFLNSELGAY